MKTRMMSVLLTVVMICCTNAFVKADQVKIRKTQSQGGVRSIVLEPSHLMIYFTDATGVCLFGEFVLPQITYNN